jgi:CRISPR-associated protein Cas2
MWEPKAGALLGKLTATVRHRLWQKACRSAGGGSGMSIYPADNEQGFSIEFWGATNRWVAQMDGLTLIQVPAVA